MYKCVDCGYVFYDPVTWTERHGLETPPYEEWCGCPNCKGGFEEAYKCAECGEWFEKEDVFCGYCEDCLRETITYDNFLDYCEARNAERYLEQFMLAEFYDGMDCVEYVTDPFHELMAETYRRKVANAKLLGGKYHFLDLCKKFIMDDDAEEYAKWLCVEKTINL